MKRIRVVVDNRVRIHVGDDDEFAAHLRARFTFENTHRKSLQFMGINGWWDEPKTYETWTDDGDGWISIARGGLSKIVAEARLVGRVMHFEDNRIEGTPVVMPDHDLELRPYQESAIQAILEKQNCLVRSPTGSGKTSVAMAAAARTKLRTLVITPNRKIHNQWIERAENELHLSKKQIGEVRGGTYKLGPITIGITNSVGKHASDPDFAKQFGCIIADEVSLFAARSFFESVDPFPAKYRIGFSADQKRKDRKEFLIYALFGEVAYDLKHTDLVKSGHVLDVTFRIIPTDFEAPWYGIADDDDDDDEREIDHTKLIEQMVSDRERNRLIVETARTIAAKGQAVIFAHTREHCSIIETTLSGMGTDTGSLIGGADYEVEFNRTLAGLREGTLRVGVGTYKAIALGIDIPRLGYGLCATPIASNKQLVQQVRGRICRTSTGKVDAELYYMWDHKVFPRHLRNLAAWNPTTLVWHRPTRQWVPAREWLKRTGA